MKSAAAAAAVVCLLITACGPIHRVADARVFVTPGVVSGTRLPTPSPSPPPDATPTQVALSSAPCRVPMAYISEAYGWFVDFPTGKRTAAPDSQAALPGNPPGAIGLNPGLTYDTATHTWVPVPYLWLSPDGATYAYSTGGAVHAVTVTTGQ